MDYGVGELNVAERQERNAKIIELYESGLSTRKISDLIVCSLQIVQTVLTNHGICLSDRPQKRGTKYALDGQRFGRLLALNYQGTSENGTQLWRVLCDCGVEKDVSASGLIRGDINSCGCYRREWVRARQTTHGQSAKGNTTKEYIMWASAKSRAKRDKLPFDIELSDIVIPEYCPVLPYLRLDKTHTVVRMDSPTLDKLIPELGYVKSNIRVISHRANSIKSNATHQEILAVAQWLEREINGAKK